MVKPVKRGKRRTASAPQAGDLSVSEQAAQVAGPRALAGWPMAIGWAAMLIFALHTCTHMVAAGDTWVAMACGRHFVQHGVDTVEPFSSNSHKPGPTPEEIKTWPSWAQWIADTVGLKVVKACHPTGWINQNWLTHVIFYMLVPKSSYADGVSFTSNALVYWKFAIYILAIICVYYTGRLLGVNPALCAVFSCFALFAGRSFIDIRPQGFSNLLVAVFLLILALVTYRNILFIWLIVPVTVFWCNVHGGYIYVFIMLVPFLILHLLTVLPRKWTISAGSMLLWAGLYTFVHKFRAGLRGMIFEFPSIQSLTPPPPYAGKLFYLIAILIIVSLMLTARKRIKDVASYGFHIVSTAVVVLALLITMSMVEIPSSLNEIQRAEVNKYIYGNLLGFLAIISVLTTLIVVTAFLKEKLISVRLKGIYHTVAAGAVALLAVILFNPFHLTNLTHTFVISVSKHAERWRAIHEWWSAFDWGNKVGTAFPFLVLFILSIGLFVLWLLSRFMIPRLLKAPRNELEIQRKKFIIQSKIFGIATCIIVCWVVFVSFSFLALDVGSFFFCAIFAGILLLSVYKNVYFIFLMIPMILVAIIPVDPNCVKVLASWFNSPKWLETNPPGYAGRYIYPFVLLPAFVVLYIVASLLSKTIKDKYDPLHISFVASSAVVSLFLMAVIFNPFESETFWNIGRFFPLQRPWRPIYERNVGLGYAYLFDGLYVINLLAVLVWVAIPYLKMLFTRVLKETNESPAEESFQLPRIDLGMMVIGALTIYMAVRSRRFIPISAIAACPVVAMLFEQTIRAFSASRNFHRRNRLTVPAMPRSVQMFFTAAGAAVVLFFAVAWGLKFKQVYLDPWPSDSKLSSVFIRMTASDAKPFYAMKFIKDNKLAGQMFNYWTEGGFIAWGQEPDPNSGRTPLQLFMDGRAQAAYNRDIFDEWSDIMAGGQMTAMKLQLASNRKQTLTASDYAEIGRWMDEQMKKNQIWVVLMPAEVFNDPYEDTKYHAIKGLEYNPNWRLVFLDGEQKLFVDVTTPRGRELFEGVFTGQNIYPDEFRKNLILAHSYYLYMPELADRKKGFDCAVAAFNLEPSVPPMMEIMAYGAKYLELKPQVDKVCETYWQEFTQRKEQWARQDGFRHRVEAARLACYHLKMIARAIGKKDAANLYAIGEDECLNELGRLSASKRW